MTQQAPHAPAAEPVGSPRFRVLGPLEVHGPGGPLPLGTPKQRAVLAALLLNANRVVPEEHLFTLVWDDDPPPSVRGRLHVHISELRALLGKDVINRRSTGYQITVAPDDLDLHVFDATVERARSELDDGRPVMAASLFRDALSLWGPGPALGGTGEVLARHEGAALDERRPALLEELFDAELAAGRHAEVVGELDRAVGEYPYREGLAVRLMVALHRSGRGADALAVYGVTRRLLADELGTEPGRVMRDVHARIRDESTAAAPAATAPRRSGPAELPREITGFAGRGGALAALDAHLPRLADHGGVVVIDGPGGIGKSALATYWAHGVRAHFPDGQLYLDLRGHGADHERLTPLTAIGRLLRSLGIDTRRIPNGIDDQVALYRSLLATRKPLVLLDNAADAAQVLPLLVGGAVVVTSRQQLDALPAHAPVQTLSLEAMSAAEARELLEHDLGAARVAAELPAADGLAALTRGVPLALRIAAADVAANPDASIESAADDLARAVQFAELSVGGAGANPVAAALSASYRTLDQPTRRLFGLLGLVPGPDFNVRVASALAGCTAEEASHGLHALVAAHLVQRHSEDRFRMHDLVRRFAADRAGEETGARAAWLRLLDDYLAIAAGAASRFGPSTLRLTPEHLVHDAHVPPAPADPDLADRELPNLVAALRQAAAGERESATWFLADNLRTYFHGNGRRAEWLEIATHVLEAAETHGELHVQAMLHHSIGESYFREGDRERGIDHMTRAARCSGECGWRECRAAALSNLGNALEWTGRLAEAAEHTRAAAALFAELGVVKGHSLALNSLASQFHHLGRLRLAEDAFEQALELSRQHGFRFREAGDLTELGAVRFALGHLDEAEDLIVRGRDLFRELGSLYGQAWAHQWLSRLHGEAGDNERARADAARALELAGPDGDRLVEVAALVALANAEIELELFDAAHGHLDRARSVIAKGDFSWHLAEALSVTARLHSRKGEHDQAIATAREAHGIAREGGYRLAEVAALLALTEVHLRAQETDAALEVGQQTLAICRTTGHATGEARARRLLGESTADATW